MRKLLLLMIGLLIFMMGKTQYLTRQVNPFIGTANSGNTNPGAVMPWGMVSISPFNSYDTVSGSGGASPYYYGKSFIYGFTHVNMSGVGCADLGIVCLMPITGKFDANEAHCSAYSAEQASPGYYSVHLDRYDVRAELSATVRSAISCYTFPAGESHILVDLELGLTAKPGGEIKQLSDTEVAGFKNVGDMCGLKTIQTVYFVARISKRPLNAGVWSNGKTYTQFRRELAGNRIGAFFSFHTESGEKIFVKTGISYVSIENARKNMEAEQPAFDFEGTRRSAEAAWEKVLSKIRVEGGTSGDRIKFYTALYHTLLHPNVFNDVNGEYMAFGSNQTRQTNDGIERYTVFSLWDTYRCLHPFLSLVYPQRESAMVKTLLGMASESGWLPKMEYAGIESGAMTGDPALIVIADSWLRGIRDFNIRQAYDVMKHNAETPEKNNPLRPGMDDWLKYGYIPEDAPNMLHPFVKSSASAGDYENMRERRIVWGSVSTALEYCAADWSLAQIAKLLGEEKEYRQFEKRAASYRNNFDSLSGFMQPRTTSGKWAEPFDPASLQNNAFTEGNSWNYSFMVPFDVPGLIRLMGGAKRFTKRLDSCFGGGYFDITNEPDLGYPYLYDEITGSEWKTQQQVRKIISGSFKNAPDGLPGNDDCGSLSAWLVFSMMGLYPACPGSNEYKLTSPSFPKINIE
ncbi:MAG TPA: GH92 family glycosyl hydrolase, partial [Puia sp.]|nr:GH92 family glycosyl hydrolase [Puia sp.]